MRDLIYIISPVSAKDTDGIRRKCTPVFDNWFYVPDVIEDVLTDLYGKRGKDSRGFNEE